MAETISTEDALDILRKAQESSSKDAEVRRSMESNCKSMLETMQKTVARREEEAHKAADGVLQAVGAIEKSGVESNFSRKQSVSSRPSSGSRAVAHRENVSSRPASGSRAVASSKPLPKSSPKSGAVAKKTRPSSTPPSGSQALVDNRSARSRPSSASRIVSKTGSSSDTTAKPVRQSDVLKRSASGVLAAKHAAAVAPAKSGSEEHSRPNAGKAEVPPCVGSALLSEQQQQKQKHQQQNLGKADEESLPIDKAQGATDAPSSGALSQKALADGQLEPWPMHQFLTSVDECSRSKRPQCVLLTTGAMNPPHRGHAQLLRQAKYRLQEAGYDVLAAFLSPTHDGYVGPKARSLGTMHLTGAFRLHLAQLMVQGDPFVALGAWEAQYPGHWPDFPTVAAQLQEELSGFLETAPKLKGKNGKPLVFYACGTDHAGKCGLYRVPMGTDIGVVVVPRAGDKPDPEREDRLVYVAAAAPGDVAAFSSTGIRKALKQGNFDYVTAAISEAAAHFLLLPTEEQRQAFPEDFQRIEKHIEAASK